MKTTDWNYLKLGTAVVLDSGLKLICQLVPGSGNLPVNVSLSSSATMQSLGEIEQRAPAVDAKIWCLYVCFCLPRSGLPGRCTFEGEHSLNKYCVRFYGSILILCSFFFRRDCPFTRTKQFSFLSLVATQFSRNCGRKLRKVQKSAEKFVRTTSYR